MEQLWVIPKLRYKTAPVVTTGQIIGSGTPTIDGEVKDVHD